jgi:hypothetical protein
MTFDAPKQPLGGVAKAWRVFSPEQPTTSLKHLSGGVDRALGEAKFVPISRTSLAKWMAALKG